MNSARPKSPLLESVAGGRFVELLTIELLPPAHSLGGSPRPQAFDAWIANAAWRENLTAGDVANATALIRRFDFGLRAPDALNIAIAQRCGACLLTFDGKMARSARALGVNVASY